MSRIGILVTATLGFTLTALAWCLPEAPNVLPVQTGMLDRLAGLMLLAMSLLLSLAVFHRVMREPVPTPSVRPRTSEYRRGFAKEGAHKANPVVILPGLQANRAQPRSPSERPVEVERMQNLLQQRLHDLPSGRKRATTRVDHPFDHQPS